MWQHDASEPIGKWLHIYEDEIGLRVTGQICLETQKGRDVRALLKSGVFDGLSIGFKAVKSRKMRGEPYRLLSEIDLWEISLVTFPALKGARVEAVKSLSYTTKGFPDQPRDDRGRWLSTDWEPDSGDRVEGGGGGTPRTNGPQNKQFNDACKGLGLTKDQKRILHDAISGQNLGFHEIRAEAKCMFNK